MKPFKIIETFSGIGSQAKAFELIKRENPSFNYDIVATVEWEIGAMFAYDIIHHGKQDIKKYSNYSKNDFVDILKKYTFSSDGKTPLKTESLKRMPEKKLKAILHSIENNNNLVDITAVHAKNLPIADLLTYSFPCQDLSISSYWHKNFSGIDRDANNRSGLLWEIERILKEYQQENLEKPRFLLMENVTAIKSPRHIKNFNIWIEELEQLGYKSYINMDLNAKDFGIPQNRKRTYMLSVLIDSEAQWEEIYNFLENSDIHRKLVTPRIDNYLRLEYDASPKYFNEAIRSIPNKTDSRDKICEDSEKLAYGSFPTDNIAKTITTKQDRNPNAGIIIHKMDLPMENKSMYRNLTPRETFLLMGFEEKDFDVLIENNINVTKKNKMLSHGKLLQLSGNSIVVNVLKVIFSNIIYINNYFFDN